MLIKKRFKSVFNDPTNTAITQHQKEIENNCQGLLNIKQFIDLYNWKCIVYLTSINDNNYTSFEEITLVVLYVDVDVK